MAGEPSMPELLIPVTVLPAGDGVCSVMRLAGEADMGSSELRDALTTQLAAKPRLLLVDMSALTFIDSAATQMIIAAHRVARHEGETLALVHPTAPVARVLSLVGVDQMINIYDNVDEAITAAR